MKQAPLFPVRERYRGPHSSVIAIEADRVIADPGRPSQRVYHFSDEEHKALAIVAARAGLPNELLRCNAVIDGNMVRVTGPHGSIAGFFLSDSIAVHQLTYDQFAKRENANAQSNPSQHPMPSSSTQRDS